MPSGTSWPPPRAEVDPSKGSCKPDWDTPWGLRQYRSDIWQRVEEQVCAKHLALRKAA